MSNDKKTLSIHETVMAEKTNKENNEFGRSIQPEIDNAAANYTGGCVLHDDGSLKVIIQLKEKMLKLSEKFAEIQLKSENFIQIFQKTEIAEEDYNNAKKLISEELQEYNELAASVFNDPVYVMFDSVFKQWTDFRDTFDSNCDEIILNETKFKKYAGVIDEKIATLTDLVSEVEEDMKEEEVAIFDGMLEVSGQDFKSFLADHEVISIKGLICNVTDRSMVVQATQPLTLNEFGKIRPPYSVIKNDTPIFIEEIEFYNKDVGEILSVEDLAEIF